MRQTHRLNPFQLSLAALGILVSISTVEAQSEPSQAAQSGPVVARLEMKLTLNKEVIDVIEKGDLLTVLAEREESFVIRTFNGHKGAVAKGNAVTLAESVPIYDELIAENPDVGRLYTLRASALLALGETDKALEDYSMAIDKGYDTAEAYSSRGLFFASVGKLDEAIEDYTTALEKDPKEQTALINRASVYMTTGKYDLAIADYTAATKLRPENPVLYSQRAIAKKLLGNLEDALKDYDQTIELAEKDVSAFMGRGFIHFQLENHEKAIADFGRAMELSPKSAVAANNRGYNYQLLGEHEKALQDFSTAVELAPQYLLALQNKGWLLATCPETELRDPVAAVEIAERICQISEFKDPSDLTLLAAAYAATEDYKSALGWQEKAIEAAAEEQKPTLVKVLDLYRNEKQLDPKLLEAEAEEKSDAEATEG